MPVSVSSSTKSWLAQNKQQSIRNIMLSKECANIQSRISVEQSTTGARRRRNKQTSSTSSSSRKKINSSTHLSKQDTIIRIARLRKNCHDAKSSLSRLEEIQNENPENQRSRGDDSSSLLLRKERNRCQVAIEAYEKQFDLLQEILSEESRSLEEQRIILEREIVGAVSSIDDIFE
jgi:hypothetical protein